MENGSTRSPLIVSAVLSNCDSLSDDSLVKMLMVTMWSAMVHEGTSPEAFNLDGKCVIFVESSLNTGSTEKIPIMRISLDRLEMTIATYEARPVDKEKMADDPGPQPACCLAIGSVAFCQGIIHYLATGNDGKGQTWALHYLRRLNSAAIGHAIWIAPDEEDNTPPQFVIGNLAEMVEEFNRSPAV